MLPERYPRLAYKYSYESIRCESLGHLSEPQQIGTDEPTVFRLRRQASRRASSGRLIFELNPGQSIFHEVLLAC